MEGGDIWGGRILRRFERDGEEALRTRDTRERLHRMKLTSQSVLQTQLSEDTCKRRGLLDELRKEQRFQRSGEVVSRQGWLHNLRKDTPARVEAALGAKGQMALEAGQVSTLQKASYRAEEMRQQQSHLRELLEKATPRVDHHLSASTNAQRRQMQETAKRRRSVGKQLQFYQGVDLEERVLQQGARVDHNMGLYHISVPRPHSASPHVLRCPPQFVEQYTEMLSKAIFSCKSFLETRSPSGSHF